MIHQAVEPAFDSLDTLERPAISRAHESGRAGAEGVVREAPPGAYSFRRRMLEGLLRAREPSRRHLRAIEYVAYHVLTWKKDGLRRLQPAAVQKDILEQHGIRPDLRTGEDAEKRYRRIIDGVLTVRSLEQLEAEGWLEKARNIKYELGKRYVTQEAIRASVSCLLVLERLVSFKGFIGDHVPREPAWLQGRLPPEPHPERPILPHGAEEIVDIWEQFEMTSDTMPEGRAVLPTDTAPDRSGQSGPPGHGGALPLTGVSKPNPAQGRATQVSRNIPLPPWELEAQRLGKAAARTRSRVRTARPKRRSKAAEVVARQQHARLRTLLLGITVLFTLVAVLATGHVMFGDAVPVPSRSDAYQAYQVGPPQRDLIASARRLDGRLLLTAGEAWSTLSMDEQHAMMAEMARAFIGEDGISEIALLGDGGTVLAQARGTLIAVTQPGGARKGRAGVPPGLGMGRQTGPESSP